jgi:uncharacterized heparinase superfamily protein
MFEYVAAYTKPNGLVPLHGDADDGRMQQLGTEDLNDHRYLLSVGAVLFERADFKRDAGNFYDGAFWLLGPSSAEAFERLPDVGRPAGSVAFREGGIYVLRDRETHVFVDCAEIGLAGRGGHGHNDILGFELFLAGSNVVTDCGAYVYTASAEWRDRFRSTAFHNTVQVDDEELNRFIEGDLWRLHYDAVPTQVSWTVTPADVRLVAGHAGYRRLQPPVGHDRAFLLRKEQDRLVIVDRLSGEATRTLTSRFYLDPSVTPVLDGRTIRLRVDRRDFWFALLTAPEGTTLAIDSAWISPGYGRKIASTCIVAACRTQLPAQLIYAFTAEPPAAIAGELLALAGELA